LLLGNIEISNAHTRANELTSGSLEIRLQTCKLS